MVKNKEDVIEVLKKNQQEILQFGVQQYWLFGSFVNSTPSMDSDVDILVEFLPGKKTFDNFINLIFFLEKILNRKVDLITKNSLSPYIGPKILQEVEDVPFSS